MSALPSFERVRRLFGMPSQAGSCPAERSEADDLLRVIAIDGAGARRLSRALTLRTRRRRETADLRRRGAAVVRAFAVIPDLDRPTFIVELDTAAAGYAADNLPVGPRGRLDWLRQMLGRYMGCDPATGAVVLIGVKSL